MPAIRRRKRDHACRQPLTGLNEHMQRHLCIALEQFVQPICSVLTSQARLCDSSHMQWQTRLLAALLDMRAVALQLTGRNQAHLEAREYCAPHVNRCPANKLPTVCRRPECSSLKARWRFCCINTEPPGPSGRPANLSRPALLNRKIAPRESSPAGVEENLRYITARPCRSICMEFSS